MPRKNYSDKKTLRVTLSDENIQELGDAVPAMHVSSTPDGVVTVHTPAGDALIGDLIVFQDNRMGIVPSSDVKRYKRFISYGVTS